MSGCRKSAFLRKSDAGLGSVRYRPVQPVRTIGQVAPTLVCPAELWKRRYPNEVWGGLLISEKQPHGSGDSIARAMGGVLLIAFVAALFSAAILTGRLLERQDKAIDSNSTPEARSAIAAEASLRLSLWQTLISGAGLAGLAFTVHYARKAWKAARDSADADNAALAEARRASEDARRTAASAEEANRISREALAASQRPWLSLTNVRLIDPLTFHPQNGWRVSLAFEFLNVGGSPAFNVMPNFKVMVARNMNLPAVHQEFAEELRGRNDFNFGQVIFPGQPGEQHVASDITLDEFALAMEWPNDERLLHPTIIGAITYRSVSGSKHLTGFQLQITMADLRTVVVPSAPPEGFAVKDLRLMKQLMGWFAD